MVMGHNKKVLLCGYFAFGTDDNGGQPVKARETYWTLEKMYGTENVHYVETLGWKHHPFGLILCFFKESLKHDYIIMLPAHHGVKIFSRLLCMSKKLLHKKIYYFVVGGWLPEKVKENKALKKSLLNFDGIWVETTTMKTALEREKFDNVTVVANFKSLTALTLDEIENNFELPLSLCVFSRIMEEKGIEDAINAVISINQEADKVIFSLDIFGQIYELYREQFEKMQQSFPKYIHYNGIVPASESVDTIKQYYALLFPTHFYTEGIPGTLIDAVFAGVPVITSLWMNYRDVFKEGITGWGYDFERHKDLELLLRRAYKEKDEFIAMRKTCLQEAEKYSPETVSKLIDGLLV